MTYLSILTIGHTAISLVAILAGIVAIAGLLGTRVSEAWTTWFLATAVATSVTGFFFPFNGLLPSHIVGLVALAVLAAAIVARYSRHLAGSWRWIYAAGMVASLYFLVFVLVAQLFLKVPSIHALAPTQAEPPFAIAQTVVLVVFVAVGFLAARRFRPADLTA